MEQAEHSALFRLQVEAGPHCGESHDLSAPGSAVIGRDPTAQVRLHRDSHFSRFHCRIETSLTECYLVDLDSRNGTFVNDVRVREATLRNGDIVSGGHTRLRVSAPETRGDTADVPTVVTDLPESPNASSDGRPLLVPPGYDVRARLGRGAMGEVYEAVQRATGRVLALKIIHPAHAATDRALQLFVREASILSGLRHPGIVQFYELGMHEGQLFLSMELVRTITLEKVLGSRSRESQIRICCALAGQVLDALGHAHALDIVHRDVKPANILLSANAGRVRPVLSDFGLAKNYLTAGFSGITRDGEMRGTVAFMPPEQILNCRHATPQSDIYSLGATLYKYLTGHYPYDFVEGRNKYATILEKAAVPIRERCPEVPEELAGIIHRALARDPWERFASADDMRLALRPYARRGREPDR